MNKFLLFLILVFIASCDYGVEWRDSPYVVMWVDKRDNRKLNHEITDNASIGRVDYEVIAVGSNDKFVVAKQRSMYGEVSYFYIDRAQDDKYLNMDEITKGPFSEIRYHQLKKEKGFPEFSQTF